MPNHSDNDCTEVSDAEPGYVHSVAPDPRRQDLIFEKPRAVDEEGCYAYMEQKKYYIFEQPNESVHIKRNLTPSEYLVSLSGDLYIPYMLFERMKNEVAAIKYIKESTAIPVPNIRCAFEDRGRYYIITDLVPGIVMENLPEEKKATVIAELQGYIVQMHALKSNVMGGLLGDIIPPLRMAQYFHPDEILRMHQAETPEFVFCHNDLGQHNIIVDEKTLKINAILDWEYAGFYPPEFDAPFYLRQGPSSAINWEENDEGKVWQTLKKWMVDPPED